MPGEHSTTTLQALPEYRVRHSPRARHVILTINPVDGLVVIVPRGFDERLIPELVHTKRAWIAAQLKQSGRVLTVNERWQRPTQVTLPALNQSWTIHYRAHRSTTVRISSRDDGRLYATGAVDDEAHTRAALRRWLKRRADDLLPPRVAELADRHGFSFTRVTVRHQRSRWGSCSTRGTISLNAKLMFVAPELVDYVLLHELCHTLHAHHGDAFQTLLAGLVADHRQQRAALRQAWAALPNWAHR